MPAGFSDTLPPILVALQILGESQHHAINDVRRAGRAIALMEETRSPAIGS
jgi:hypothetical protein